MKRRFDPAVLEMMDRPQPVSAELERDLERIRQFNRWFGSYWLVSGFMRHRIQPGSRARIASYNAMIFKGLTDWNLTRSAGSRSTLGVKRSLRRPKL